MKKENFLVREEENCTIHFRQIQWQSSEVLKELKAKDINISEKTKIDIHDAIWRNITSEYDAVHLSKLIHINAKKLSSVFMDFEPIWFKEEMNHYTGLRQIYSNIYNINEHELHKKVSARVPDFTEILPLFEDEFLFYLTFAYVELVGMRGYVEVFPIYDSYRVPALSRWVRLAARDELYHCINIKNILQLTYPHKLHMVPNALKEIVQREDLRSADYTATFLFDHEPPRNENSSMFLKRCANEICRYLHVPNAFEEINSN